MRKYTTLTKIENYLLITVEHYFRPQVEEWIESVSKLIETKTGRVFIADEEATWRKFELEEGSRKFFDAIWGRRVAREIRINECIEVGELKVDDEEIEDYLVYPANELPKNRIRIESGKGYFTSGEQNIEVKAKWGYSADVPADIEQVATVLVAGIIGFSAKDEMKGGKQSEKIGPYSVTFSDAQGWSDFERSKEILESYKLKLPL